MRPGTCLIVLLLILPIAAGAEMLTGFEALQAWDSLPLARTGESARLASSYDRSGLNQDYGFYESPTPATDAPVVIASLIGTGFLTRIWMPHRTAIEAFPITITIDGAIQIDTTSDVLLGGAFGYIDSPFAQTLVGGQVVYEPIAFQESCLIESWHYVTGSWSRRRHYYQYSYRLLSGGQQVIPFSGTLTPEQQAARDDVVNMIANVGDNPAGASPISLLVEHGPTLIPAGATLVLAELTGPGTIRRLNLDMPGATDAELDGLRLVVRYADLPADAIDVPTSHFFGAGHDRVPYRSLPLGTDSPQGFYCYWPMPFRRGVTVELHNTTAASINITSATIEHEPGPVPPTAGYLHARFSEETTTAGQLYHVLLDIEGQGHYIGNMLYLEQAGANRQILEGDNIVTVDGVDTILGTGLEDAYNGGYYYNHVVLVDTPDDPPYPEHGIGPIHGLLHMEDPNAPGSTATAVRTDQYRWRFADNVPFTRSITVKVENWGSQAGVLFGSTAFYYLIHVVADFNADHYVDGNDLAIFASCASGPAVAHDGSETCQQADFDGDGDVDQRDFAVFQRCYSGEGNPADPNCVN
jgi:hypothetical protein